MPMFPLRIRFVDADHAYERFHSFPPGNVDYILGWSRKRDGDSQIILLHLASEAHMQDFLALCRQQDSIVGHLAQVRQLLVGQLPGTDAVQAAQTKPASADDRSRP